MSVNYCVTLLKERRDLKTEILLLSFKTVEDNRLQNRSSSQSDDNVSPFAVFLDLVQLVPVSRSKVRWI